MVQQLLLVLFLTIAYCIDADDLGSLSCYRNYGYTLGVEEVRCAPPLAGSPTYCLKADVYDGRVVRDCASAAQCPQGEGCAPITYDQDGTTDFVCCCSSSDLCNGSMAPRNSDLGIVITLIFLAFSLAFFA